MYLQIKGMLFIAEVANVKSNNSGRNNVRFHANLTKGFECEQINVIVCPLHDVPQTNAGRVCMSVQLPACFNSGTDARILMKSRTDITSLKATSNSYFLFPAISNTNMTGVRICDRGVRAT
jgi:hypothetical protein